MAESEKFGRLLRTWSAGTTYSVVGGGRGGGESVGKLQLSIIRRFFV
jgi:hypothetical protein